MSASYHSSQISCRFSTCCSVPPFMNRSNSDAIMHPWLKYTPWPQDLTRGLLLQQKPWKSFTHILSIHARIHLDPRSAVEVEVIFVPGGVKWIESMDLRIILFIQLVLNCIDNLKFVNMSAHHLWAYSFLLVKHYISGEHRSNS